MKSEKTKKIIFGILLLVVVFILDRITKIIILNIAEETGKVDIYINSFLNLYLVWNKGIGFGLLSFDQEYVYDAVTYIILIINLIIVYLIISEIGYRSYFLLVILGGSSSILFDRLYFNAVPDFIDLNYNGFHWFIFNVADIFITIGIISLIIAELVVYKKVK